MRKLYGIMSLDLSLPVHVPARSSYHGRGYSVPWHLPRMRINVQDIDLYVFCWFDVLVEFFQLEKVTWNNIDSDSCIFLDGYNFTTSSNNLRELVMDDSVFQCDSEEEKNCPIWKNIPENFYYFGNS